MYRVLHVVTRMGYGGIETLLMNIYRNIDREYVQFDFVVTSKIEGEYDNEIKELGGNIYYLPKRSKRIIRYIKTWKKFLKDNANKYNTIHVHVSSLTNITPIKLARKYGIRNIFVHAHNTHQNGIMHNILNIINRQNIAKEATRLFACSTEAGKYCFGKNRFEVLKNGILTDKFIFNEQIRKEKRIQFKLKNNNLAIINVARFSEQKNHKFLIDIFNEIYSQNEKARLYLVGDGPLKTEIEKKVTDMKLNDVVYFLNKRNDVNEILQAMDLFIMPSLHEGLPVVGIEAQASGLPIYISDTVSAEVKITDLVTFYSLQESAENWAKNILDTINTKKRSNMQFQIIEAGYDIVNTAKILEQYYKE